MNPKLRIPIAAVCILVALCGSAGASPGSQDLVNEGRTSLFNGGEFTEAGLLAANDKFEAAVNADPSDPEANLFYALTRLAVLFYAPYTAGAPIDNLNELLDGFGMSVDIFTGTATFTRDGNGNVLLPPDTPSGPAIQNYLQSGILPEIGAALANLSQIDEPFGLLLTQAETGMPYDIEVDYGDVRLLRSLLHAATAAGYVLLSYDLDIDFDAVYTQVRSGAIRAAPDLLGAYPAFLTLLQTGAADMNAAKGAAIHAIDEYLAASDFLREEAGGADTDLSDDLIALAPEDAEDEAEFRLGLEAARYSLKNGETVAVGPDALRVRFGDLFDNPLTLRDYFPAFTRDVYTDALVFRGVNALPDPTFGGILPDGIPTMVGAVSVYGMNTDDGPSTVFDCRLRHLPPWHVASITVWGPSGKFDFDLETGPVYHPEFGTAYRLQIPTLLSRGWYEFEITNRSGRSERVSKYFTPNPIDRVEAGMDPEDTGYTATTGPTFTWHPVSDETISPLYYRVNVLGLNSDQVFYTSDRSTAVGVTIPAGILEDNTSYRWNVEVFDGPDDQAANNGSLSRFQSFCTGSAGNPLGVDAASVRARTSVQRDRTRFSIRLTGPAPFDVSTISISGPDGYSLILDPSHYISFGNAYYFNEYGILPDGTYTFTVEAGDGSSVSVDRDVSFNRLPVPDAVHSILHRASIQTATPTFSWDPVEDETADPVYYRVYLSDVRENPLYASDRIQDTTFTLPPGILKPHSPYFWRVEVFDAQADPQNRTDGDLKAFYVTNFGPTATLTGEIDPGSSGYTSGPIIVEAVDADGNILAHTSLSGPGPYTLYNLPAGVEIFIRARWDADGSGTPTPGDWTAAESAMFQAGADPPPLDITLNHEVQAASVSGSIRCADFVEGKGQIFIFAYDGPDPKNDRLLASTTVDDIVETYTLTQLPEDSHVYLFARWDADGSGTPTPADYVGFYDGNPIRIQSGGHTGIDIRVTSPDWWTDLSTPNLYDDFSDPHINVQMWDLPELVREVDESRGLLATKTAVATPPARTNPANRVELNVSNPLASVAVDVAVPTLKREIEPRITLANLPIGEPPRVYAGAEGNFYSSDQIGFPPGTGDVEAGIYMGDRGQGLEAWQEVNGVIDPITTSRQLATGNAYTLKIDYDGSTDLAFSVYDTADGSLIGTQTVSGPGRRGEAFSPRPVLISTGLFESEDTGSLRIEAIFDNVFINGNLYEDFETPPDDLGVAPLHPGLWKTREYVRDITPGGKLRLKSHSEGDTETARIIINDPTPYTQAAVTVRSDSWVSIGARGRARIDGYVYNDTYGPGSGLDYNGNEGNVWAAVYIDLYADGYLEAKCYAERATDPDHTHAQELFFKRFETPIQFNTPYTLSMGFTGSELIFGCIDEVIRYPIQTDAYAPSDPSRSLKSRVYGNTTGRGVMDVLFDDVYAAESTGPGMITGFVMDAVDGQPIEGITVFAWHYDGGMPGGGSSRTDENGFYAIKNLPEGDYRVYFSTWNTDYIEEYYEDAHVWESAARVPVLAGQAIDGIDAELDIAGKITGTVTGPDGAGISGLWVESFNTTTNTWNGYAQTGADGFYEMGRLRAGRHRVWVPNFTTDYVLEYYDGVYDYDSATLIDIDYGETVSGIDFQLELGGKIHGKVTGPDGTPLGNVRVHAQSLSTGGTNLSASTQTDGWYTIKGLPEGTYRVYADASEFNYIREYYDNVYNMNSATAVSVSEAETTEDIHFQLEIGGTITGRVTDPNGIGLSGLWVYANDYSTGDWVASQTTQSDGSYGFTGLAPGSYRILAATYYTPYIREYYDNAYSYVSASIINVSAEEVIENIDFNLERGGTISGTVRDRFGNPIQNLWMTFYNDQSGEFMSGANTQNDGTYTVALPSGSFRVYACASCSNLPYNNRYYGAPTPVSVTVPLNTSGIDFQLESLTSAGDVDGNGTVDLVDAILALQAAIGMHPAGIDAGADVDGDGKIGLAEVIYIFQVLGGMRQP